MTQDETRRDKVEQDACGRLLRNNTYPALYAELTGRDVNDQLRVRGKEEERSDEKKEGE